MIIVRMAYTDYLVCVIAVVLSIGVHHGRAQPGAYGGDDEDNEVYNPISLEQINTAGQQARNAVRNVENLEKELKRKGYTTRRGSPSFFHQALFRGDPVQLADCRYRGILAMETTTHLVDNLDMPVTSRAQRINDVSLQNAVVSDACPRQPMCNPTRYRSVDGSCNNLENIAWGKSFTAFVRWLPPEYDDGVDSPRRRSLDRGPLPNPRAISTRLSPDVDSPSRTHTSLLMQWGQFLDHDITNTALTTDTEGEGIICCFEEIRNNASLQHPACFPIDIPAGDAFYSPFDQTCMEFVRSQVAPVENCRLGQRQQLNIITSFIDGSVIYGSSENETRELRSFVGGRLRSSATYGGGVMPPDDTAPCGNQEDEPPCFRAGDNRVNENTLLAVFHQIWFREHNRIAGILARTNRGWNDEIIYQESRRIVAAMIQHITYSEFLPIILGQRVMAQKHLNIQRDGFFEDYDKNLNPSLSNVFATAAYRLGHTLVQGRVNLISRENQVSETLNLASQFFAPALMYQEDIFDMFVRGLAATPSQGFDTFFTDQLTEHLFQRPGFDFGLDLVALNIQRGRDHGIAGYGEWRTYCNLSNIANFEQLSSQMNQREVAIFRELYRNVQDIDLYVAGISERPARRDSLVGPTFSCLLAEQFRRLKFGDRFWYENGGMESSFRESQLEEIRKVTLARVLCDNSNIQSIQRNAFLIAGRRNPVETCIQGNIPRMSLEPWQNEPVWSK